AVRLLAKTLRAQRPGRQSEGNHDAVVGHSHSLSWPGFDPAIHPLHKSPGVTSFAGDCLPATERRSRFPRKWLHFWALLPILMTLPPAGDLREITMRFTQGARGIVQAIAVVL